VLVTLTVIDANTCRFSQHYYHSVSGIISAHEHLNKPHMGAYLGHYVSPDQTFSYTGLSYIITVASRSEPSGRI
jgi:hypothetical protein